MASIIHSLSLTILFAFLHFPNPIFSADSPGFAPSPSPHLPPQLISPPPDSPSPSPALPNSPPSPPPSDLAPNEDDGASSEHKSSPSPSPSPAPAPDVSADISLENQTNVGELEAHSGGMNGGQKAGIAIGLIAGASIVGIGAVVYKKRQQNIRRSEHAYTTRREIL